MKIDYLRIKRVLTKLNKGMVKYAAMIKKTGQIMISQGINTKPIEYYERL